MALSLRLAGRNVPRAARDVPAPKERGVKHTVRKSIPLGLFKFNAFISSSRAVW
jgi:hypothetical protein